MSDSIYRRLAEHLDRLPGGFAPSETGADLRLLQRLFTPEEAELATHLTLDRETALSIAQRAGLPAPEAGQRLDEMARKGLILATYPQSGPTLYQAAPFVVGIYELQVNNLSEGLLHDLDDYWSTIKPRPPVQTIPQMRIIPVGQSIKPNLEALPYEQVNEMVRAQDRFAVAPCICRRRARLTGGGCSAPEESCLVFGDWAGYYVRTGRGRAIDRSEVQAILARADAANLVLRPSNSRHIEFLCCCCSCCCGGLQGLKHHPTPAQVAASRFIARFEPEACQECHVCLERCPIQALTAADERVTFNAERCIGCGLCVSTCPSGALTLLRKPDSELADIPADLDAAWRAISQARAR